VGPGAEGVGRGAEGGRGWLLDTGTAWVAWGVGPRAGPEGVAARARGGWARGGVGRGRRGDSTHDCFDCSQGV
jgi:hypothetical protein